MMPRWNMACQAGNKFLKGSECERQSLEQAVIGSFRRNVAKMLDAAMNKVSHAA
jgi:hypothetical protein